MTAPRWNVSVSVEVRGPATGREAIDRALAVIRDRPYGSAFDVSAYAVHTPVRGLVDGQSVLLARDEDADDE